jgi:hypothetical protein
VVAVWWLCWLCWLWWLWSGVVAVMDVMARWL